MRSRAISIGIVLACTGCMSGAVFDYRGDAPAPTASERLDATLAVNDLAIPNTRTEFVGANVPPSVRFGDARFNVGFEETALDLRAQMRDALASRPAAPIVAQQSVTAGGELPEFESPEFEATVRARLDERAARILLCTNTDAAAVTVEWTGPGATSLSVRDADAVVVGCVRAALGDLVVPARTPAGRLLHVVSQ